MHEFAALVPCSIDTVRKAIWEGLFVPHVVGGIGRGKPHLLLSSQLPAFREFMQASKSTAQIDADARYSLLKDHAKDVVRACVLLGEGATLREIVVKLEIHPDVVELACEKWARLERGFYLSAKDVETIEQLPLDGPLPLRGSSDLLEVLRIASTQTRCACGKEAKSICGRCARAAVAKAKRETPLQQKKTKRGKAEKREPAEDDRESDVNEGVATTPDAHR